MSKCVVVIDVAIVCFECSPNYLVPGSWTTFIVVNLTIQKMLDILTPLPPAPLHQTCCQLIRNFGGEGDSRNSAL